MGEVLSVGWGRRSTGPELGAAAAVSLLCWTAGAVLVGTALPGGPVQPFVGS